MRTLAQMISRILILSLVAAAFVGLTGAWARSIQPPPVVARRGFLRERRRRPSAPQFQRVPSFFGEIVLIGGIAFGGRKLLHLRLSE